MTTEICEVVTTIGNETSARSLAVGMVEARLAACVQVEGPITSIYRWKGTIETATEYRLTAKVHSESVPKLMAWIHSHHEYETPEVIVRTVEGSEAYARWVQSELLQPE